MQTHDWPFDQAPNVTALTTRQVLDEGAPILVVVHYEDDRSWAFLCGTTDAEEDGRVIGMGAALRIDPTLKQIADLPPGWRANRSKVGRAWHRKMLSISDSMNNSSQTRSYRENGWETRRALCPNDLLLRPISFVGTDILYLEKADGFL